MKVALAALKATNARSILEWLGDPLVSRNLGLRSAPTLARTRAFIAARDESVCPRAIYADGEHVGVVTLDQIDRHVLKARLHIYIGAASVRGRGVGQRAVGLALSLAFEELGLNKVWLTVHAKNPGAVAAYVSAGFQVEGIHRDEFVLDGERVNELYMGILASEWRAREDRQERGQKRVEKRPRS